MIAALIIGGYVLVGLVVGLVIAYMIRLDDRLADRPTDWDEGAPIAFAIGIIWPVAALVWCGSRLLALIRRGIDTAVEAEVEERNARDRDADP